MQALVCLWSGPYYGHGFVVVGHDPELIVQGLLLRELDHIPREWAFVLKQRQVRQLLSGWVGRTHHLRFVDLLPHDSPCGL